MRSPPSLVQVDKYTYEVCPFAKASQKEGHSSTSLGTWSGLEDNGTRMAFKNGAGCWQGPSRSITVGGFQVGIQAKVVPRYSWLLHCACTGGNCLAQLTPKHPRNHAGHAAVRQAGAPGTRGGAQPVSCVDGCACPGACWACAAVVHCCDLGPLLRPSR